MDLWIARGFVLRVHKQPLKYFRAGSRRSGEGRTDKVGAGAAGDGFAASGKTADGFCCDLSE